MALRNSISDALRRLSDALVPTRRRSHMDALFQHQPIAHTLTADRLHQIVRMAENGDTIELFGLFEEIVTNDPHIQAEFSKRKLALLCKPPTLAPWDPEDADDEKSCEACQALLDHPDWMDAMKKLLDGHLFPVAVLEKQFQPSMKPDLRFELASFKPVDNRLLSYITRRLQIEDTNEEGMPIGTFHEADRFRYVTHRGHLLTSPDYWGGPMRSLLFWWLFATMDRDWWARFLERFGTPFIVGKFEQSDDAGRGILLSAFSNASRLFGLVISTETEVEVHDVTATNEGDAFIKFHSYAAEQMSKLIVGQTTSAESKHSSMGEGASKLHGQVRDDIREWDAISVTSTVRTQVFAHFLSVNAIPGRAPRMFWGGEQKDDAVTTSTVIMNMKQAGLEPTDEAVADVSERLGIEFQRAAPTPTPPAPGGRFADKKPDATLSAGHTHAKADPLESIASAGSADLARAFRASLAPVARIIRESKSAAECESKVAAFTAGWRPGEAADLLQNALVAFSANAVASSRRP